MKKHTTKGKWRTDCLGTTYFRILNSKSCFGRIGKKINRYYCVKLIFNRKNNS